MPSAPRQITSHLPWYLTFLSLTGWPSFPKRLGKYFVTLGSTSGPAIGGICPPALLAAEAHVQRHLLQPLAWGKEGGSPPSPGAGAGTKGCCFGPPLVPLQPAHRLPAGPRGSRAHEPHLLARFLCSSGKSASSAKIITAARFIGMQSPEIPNRPVACQGKHQHLETLQRQRERSTSPERSTGY